MIKETENARYFNHTDWLKITNDVKEFKNTPLCTLPMWNDKPAIWVKNEKQVEEYEEKLK